VQNVIRTNIPELDSQLLYYNKIVSPKLFKDAASFDHSIEIYVDDLSQVEKIKKNFESKGFLVQHGRIAIRLYIIHLKWSEF